MSEELLQRNLLKKPEKIGKWDFYNIGNTTLKSLKEHNIIRNVDYGEVERKKVDAIIVFRKNVIAVIEYKKPTEFSTKEKQNKAIQQEIEVAKKLGCKLIIATDTQATIWVNALTGKQIKDENNQVLKMNFDPQDEKIVYLIEKINYSINELNNRIKPKQLVNPTDLAKQIWQDIWSVSGATPENCLYTFVELFIFKYLSDLEILQGIYNFDTLISSFETNSADEILENYASIIRPKIKELFPMNPVDKTTIINGTIFVSKDQKAVTGYSTVFKKILLKFRDYGKLENIDYDFKSKLFESFLKESISKKNWGQFFTPLKVVRAIVEMAKTDIKDGISICDPACGVGKFLLEPLVTRLDYLYDISKKGIIPKITIHGFDKGFDKDEQKTIILAKANMLIYFSDLIRENAGLTKQFSQIFNDSFTLKTNSILGTLSDVVIEQYDLILTNPPYVTSGSSNLKEEIRKDGELVNHYKVNALGVEGLFMEWIIKALKPNGKAFVVIPDGMLNRQNDKNLRKYILDECFIDGIISLPLNTFFTTNKKTYILCITKKADKKQIQTEPVFTYLVSEIGESRDVYRFDIDQNDLGEAVTLFSFFKSNKSEFAKINVDKRCKIQPIKKFAPDTYWSVDRWWTKNEQIELGIVEEDKTLDISAFSEMINDISETLKEYSDLLKEISEKKNSVSNHQKIFLSDKKYFDLFIGKRLVKRDLVHIDGDIPIYSANVKNPISFHTQSNIDDFSNDFVIWGIDGDFEFNYIPKNKPFVTTDHCGTIRILNDSILPEFLMIQLENVKYLYGFDRGLRSSLKNMQNVSIQMPVDEAGNIDIEKQKEIIEKHEPVKELKDKAIEYQRKINNLNIDVELDYRFKMEKIAVLFDIEKGASEYTRKYGNINSGEYPVYSASNHEPLAFINTFDYDGEYFTWATNGFAGYVKIISGKFSINADRGLLKPKKENIDIWYIKYRIEPILRELAKGRKGEKGEDEFTKLYPSMIGDIEMPIPVDRNGNFDLVAQKEIAEKYQKIEQIKKDILEKLDKITNTVIELI
ncbi:MAG: N-6 DNA methylase [Treponema sp.]|jgi:type I restriction-modification system DNA methylase subunit|nr:N-6 DNA methylase [Treponema sp.]